jgi:hypothetical protein
MSRKSKLNAAATGLGWTSIAIGLTEILAPEQLKRTLGIKKSTENTGILRILGLREVMHGFDLLTHKDPMPGIRARCAGDLLDNVLLGAAATRTKNIAGFLTIFGAVLPVVALDMLFAKKRRLH